VHKVLLTGRKNTASAGSICSVGKNGIEVVCSDGYTVIITEIQKQGKKKMDAYSFSLGHKVIVNENIMNI
jgi:methionyl-tRNA formyltransferase